MASRHVLERRNLLALYVARAIAFFRQQPAPLPPVRSVSGTSSGPPLPSNLPRLARSQAAVQSDMAELELRMLAPPRDVSAECSAEPSKPKRVRPPKTKLYACDVEAGALYVPKRGNDKTPRLRVVMVVMDESETPARVWFCRENEPDKVAVHPDGTPVADFLALVARRVTP